MKNTIDKKEKSKMKKMISEKVNQKKEFQHFQTPKIVCEYMAGFIFENCGTILEPTPGIGNLVDAVKHKGIVVAPKRFEDIEAGKKFDWVIMNPPFSPMIVGFDIFMKTMEMSDNIIALLPWLVLLNSSKRMDRIKEFGLVSITNLPRKAFKGSRVQTCILFLQKGYKKETVFKTFDWE